MPIYQVSNKFIPRHLICPNCGDNSVFTTIFNLNLNEIGRSAYFSCLNCHFIGYGISNIEATEYIILKGKIVKGVDVIDYASMKEILKTCDGIFLNDRHYAVIKSKGYM